MKILLDTHVLLWLLLEDGRLGTRQFGILEEARNEIFLSAVSGFEISTKVRIGKLPQKLREINLAELCKEFDYNELPISLRHGVRGGQLHGEHRDPFDRLLAAQSLIENMPLMTNDSALSKLGVEVIW
ncbi:type II toxin-antitoxin system VapC family toxin [soil metagenome]